MTNPSREGENDEDMTKSKGNDPLEGLGEPMTRARARKAKEALQQVLSILFEYKPKSFKWILALALGHVLIIHLIQIAIDAKQWKPIQIVKRTRKLSHLALVDNLLLYAEASEEQVKMMVHIIDLFSKSSSQKVSNDNTRIYFSNNVGWQ